VVSPETMYSTLRAAGATLSPTERVYSEIVVLLAGTPTPVWQEISVAGPRAVLAECDTLLVSHRNLARQRTTLLHQANQLPKTELDLRSLEASIEGEVDPVVLDSLRQSARLCTERLGALRMAAQTATRADAQMQAIEQALMLLRSSLAVGGSTLDLRAAHATAQSIERVQSLALRLADHARVVEATTAEVGRL